MEIIFTLILLIGFGINSHRIESKRYEAPKQSITSVIQKEVQQKVDVNSNKEISHSKNESGDELKKFSNDASPKGKYISVVLTDVRTIKAIG